MLAFFAFLHRYQYESNFTVHTLIGYLENEFTRFYGHRLHYKLSISLVQFDNVRFSVLSSY